MDFYFMTHPLLSQYKTFLISKYFLFNKKVNVMEKSMPIKKGEELHNTPHNEGCWVWQAKTEASATVKVSRETVAYFPRYL